jgi:hypothetical protein
MIRSMTRVYCACAVAVLLAGDALACLSDVMLTVRVSTGSAAGTLEITADQGTWTDGDFSWSTEAPIPIMSGSEVLATFGPGNIRVYADAAVSVGYSMQTGDELTTFTFSSPLLPIHDLDPALARGNGAFTLQDFCGGGAAYEARMGCYLPDGTACWEESLNLVVVPPDVLAAGSFEHPVGGGYEPTPPASALRMEVGGTVSACSIASGSAFFHVNPEPATALLMLLGLGLIRRR